MSNIKKKNKELMLETSKAHNIELQELELIVDDIAETELYYVLSHIEVYSTYEELFTFVVEPTVEIPEILKGCVDSKRASINYSNEVGYRLSELIDGRVMLW